MPQAPIPNIPGITGLAQENHKCWPRIEIEPDTACTKKPMTAKNLILNKYSITTTPSPLYLTGTRNMALSLTNTFLQTKPISPPLPPIKKVSLP